MEIWHLIEFRIVREYDNSLNELLLLENNPSNLHFQFTFYLIMIQATRKRKE